MDISFSPTIKQDEVFQLFENEYTTEILFGGGVGAAKTYLMGSLITIKCLQYEGIRVGLCRNELTTLKKTTVVTLISEVFPNFGLNKDEHYTYNPIEGKITFFNGSEIIFQELRHVPSDPDYTRLGGLLLTFAVIDEAGETSNRGKEILQSRIGRWRNESHNIKPLLIMTCNPSRNFLYDDFYVADKEGTLPEWRSFVNATANDNPHLPEAYIQNLKRTLSPGEVSRLLLGNWDSQDDPDGIVSSEDIKEMYDHSISKNNNTTRYISADIAFKQDGCILFVWEGNDVIDIIKVGKTEVVLDKIKETAAMYDVQTRYIAYDSDGVGQFIKQYLRSAKAITNNGKALKNENYINLKSQLYYKLGELIRDGKIKMKTNKFKKELDSELLCIKRKVRSTSESKMEINSKADQKKIIGHSPDFADAMMFKMIYEYTQGGFTRML
jgi:PBSX family phage terminase large subunit